MPFETAHLLKSQSAEVFRLSVTEIAALSNNSGLDSENNKSPDVDLPNNQ